jgi:hypothetical protein
MARNLLHQIRDGVVAPLTGRLERIDRRMRDLALQWRARELDPRSLLPHGHRCFSQNAEDGMIDEIFRRIGTGPRFFVEFGVETGLENNTLALLLAGWRGLWIEADPAAARTIRGEFTGALDAGRLRLVESFVTAESIEQTLRSAGVPEDLDLLSIDIDGNDYWVWRAIHSFHPRAVVIEYNASLGRTARVVRPYEPTRRWDGSAAFGASLAALEALGQEKGYALVGCDAVGVNAMFVRQDLVGDGFLPPFTAARHYEPPRFGPTGAGHPPRWAPFEEV